MKCVFAIFLLLTLASCLSWYEEEDAQNLRLNIEQREVKLQSPEGFCFDKPSLQRRRGMIDGDVVFAEVMASNCQKANDTFTPAALTHFIIYSVTPSEAPLKNYTDAVELTLGTKGSMREHSYHFTFPAAQGGGEALVFEVGEFLVMLRVTSLQQDDKSRSQHILNQSAELLRAIN